MAKDNKYSFIKPTHGYIVIKRVEEEKGGLKKSSASEDRAYGRIVAVNVHSKYYGDMDTPSGIGALVVYNEYEGQELFKYGRIKEDGLIILKEPDILAVIEEICLEN